MKATNQSYPIVGVDFYDHIRLLDVAQSIQNDTLAYKRNEDGHPLLMHHNGWRTLSERVIPLSGTSEGSQTETCAGAQTPLLENILAQAPSGTQVVVIDPQHVLIGAAKFAGDYGYRAMITVRYLH